MNGFRSKLTDNNSDEATYVIFEPSFHTFQRDPPMLTLLAICTPDGLWLVGLAIQISSHFSGPRIFPVSDAVNHRLINGRKSADAETPDFDYVHPVCRLPIAPLRLGRFESVVACPLLLPMNIDGKLTAVRPRSQYVLLLRNCQLKFHTQPSGLQRCLLCCFEQCTVCRRRRQLEDENKRLKQMVAELSVDKHMLQEVLSKKA